eukprot:COSAG01_NODE_71452_length_256_cov_0.280255_1_plen_25_part_10
MRQSPCNFCVLVELATGLTIELALS